MKFAVIFPEAMPGTAAMKPFVLFRDHIRPAVEACRAGLRGMYAPALGRPEIDLVLLLGV